MRLLGGILAGICIIILTSLPYNAQATHSVSATPPGGTYSSAQTVSLTSSNSSAIIYYSVDGSSPTLASTQYNGSQIVIAANTTLNFIAIDPSDNHTSGIVSEIYIIDSVPFTVTLTKPENGERRVDTFSIINATFNKPVDESTLDSNTFTVTGEFDDPVSGTVTYNSTTRTASFTPDGPLSFGEVFNVALTSDVRDISGESLQPHDWNFTTGGQIRITLTDFQSGDLIGGSTFTISPNPFGSGGSLAIVDNGPFDSDVIELGSPEDGRIFVNNVENDFSTYVVSETSAPDGYSKIYDHFLVTVVQQHTCELCRAFSVLRVENLNSNVSISDIDSLMAIPSPYLNSSQFSLYKDKVITAVFSGLQDDPALDFIDPITSPDNTQLPAAQFATNETISLFTDLQSLIFREYTAESSLSGREIMTSFEIPTYPAPTEEVADKVIYAVPAMVIPYDGSKNNFVLTPVLQQVFPGMTLLLQQSSYVESKIAKVENITMTFNVKGSYVGFSFGISDTVPPDTPEPPLDAPALFLDVGFVGDEDFSNPNAFVSSPKIDILVNKTLPGFPSLPNGCPDFKLLFFNGNDWEEVQKLNPTGNFTDFCPFTLEPEHFSKFAVGGVKGQTISTEGPPEVTDRHGGGGRSRSTAVTQTPTGSDVETSINTKSGEVIVQFESIQPGSGQLRIEANELSVFEKYFDDMAFLQDDNEHGLIQLDGKTYATSGDVFDIDASSVQYSGKVDVTIPYDAEVANSIGIESDIRFLHYNDELGRWEDVTKSVDETANTVTGTLDSLSPVSAAIILNGGSSTGNPSDGQIPTQLDIRQPEVSVSQSEVLVTTELSNPSTTNQDYILIIQVLDSQSIVQQINWQTGSLQGTKAGSISMALTSLDAGDYTMQVVVVSDLENPWLLSYSKTKLAI